MDSNKSPPMLTAVKIAAKIQVKNKLSGKPLNAPWATVTYTNTAAKPPKAPSILLPGLMLGANLRLPYFLPTKYAPVSATHTNTITANKCQTSSLEPSPCKFTIAAQNGNINSKPKAYLCQGVVMACLRFSKYGTPTNQNSKINHCHTPFNSSVRTMNKPMNAVKPKYSFWCKPTIPTKREYSHKAVMAIKPLNHNHTVPFDQNNMATIKGIKTMAVRKRCFNICINSVVRVQAIAHWCGQNGARVVQMS